jgi:beta-phosphoglucomutase-like phosphatase (HAD superfamily)
MIQAIIKYSRIGFKMLLHLKGIIFDMDGVLVDSMPSHSRAWQLAFENVANIQVESKLIYKNEGRRGMELVREILATKSIYVIDISIIEKIVRKKSEIFKNIGSFKLFPGVKQVISSLPCRKAVVSGSTKSDVFNIINHSFGNKIFDVMVTADDIANGKPSPMPFIKALQELDLEPENTLVVENAPLGVLASINAGIECIVTLNNTPLSYDDFKRMISNQRIFSNLKSANKLLINWCVK